MPCFFACICLLFAKKRKKLLENPKENLFLYQAEYISCVHELNARHILLLLIGLDTNVQHKLSYIDSHVDTPNSLFLNNDNVEV